MRNLHTVFHKAVQLTFPQTVHELPFIGMRACVWARVCTHTHVLERHGENSRVTSLHWQQESSSCIISKISLCTAGRCGVDGPLILGITFPYSLRFYGPSLMKSFCHQSLGPTISLRGRRKLTNFHLVRHTPQTPSNNPPILLCNPQKRFQALTTHAFMME